MFDSIIISFITFLWLFFPSSLLSSLLSTYFFILFLRKNKLNAELLVRIEQQERHGSCPPAIAGYQKGHNPGKNHQPWASHQGPAKNSLQWDSFQSQEETVGFLRHGTFIISEFTMPGIVFRMWRLIKNHLLNWMQVTCQWHPTPVLLPGKSHGQRSLEGCSPWGRWGSDTTEQLHFHFSLSCIGEGNGNPLQCSCLENPRDGESWWAAIYGVAQSRTRLK